MKFFKNLILTILILIPFISKSSHIPGGNLTYQCTGNPNEYLLTMELFVKCPSTLSTSYSSFYFTITNDCGLSNPTVPTFNQVGVREDVTQTCPSQLSNCPPNPSGGVQGVLMYTYEALITFPSNCDSWEICFNLCCRDNATNVTGNSSNDMTFCTTINSQTQNCGSSPTVNASPIPYVCAGQPVNFCLGASDPDGDSVYYSMVTPLDDGNPVTFTPPYNTNSPLQNFVLDPLTGCVTFNQPTIGNFVVAFLIESFDQNGNLTGSVIHDFQFIVINCLNVTPSPPSGGITLHPNSGGFSTGPNSIGVCEGDSVCFDMVFLDNDTLDILSIDTSNSSIFNNLPGAIYTLSGTNPLTITVCWDVPTNSLPYINGTMTVVDNACPVVGTASQVIIIDVISSTVALKDTSICSGQPVQLSVTGGQVFNWNSLSGDPIIVGTNFSCNPCNNPIVSPNQTTVYEVTSDLSSNCNNKDTITIDIIECCKIPDVIISDATCFGYNDGKIIVTPHWLVGSEVQTITYIDSTTNNVIQTTPNMTSGSDSINVPSGTYIITITDTSGCSKDTTIHINSPDEIIITNIISDTTVCKGDIVTLYLTSTGGTGTHTINYTNMNNININPTINVVDSSCYKVFVNDVNNCYSDTEIVCLSIFDMPILEINRNKPDSCYPITVQFDNGNSNLISNSIWEFSDNTIMYGNNITKTFNIDQCIDLKLTLETINGCLLDTNISNYICPHSYPIADFIADPIESSILFPEISFTNLSIPNNVNSLWNFNNIDTTNIYNPIYMFPSEPGIYEVWLHITNQHGCSDSIMGKIVLKEITLSYIPNTFTPNLDNINDIFKSYMTGMDLSDFRMFIFDRWGKIIHESYDINNGWDGKYKGEYVQDGVYVWKIETKELFSNRRINMIGHVNVIK